MPVLPKANPSVFSGVAKFVSREFENLIANATGSALPESDVFSEEEDGEYGDEHEIVNEEFIEQQDTRSPPKKRTKTAYHPPTSPMPGGRCSQQDSLAPSKENRVGHREEFVVPGGNAGRRSASPPLSRALKRRPSISMPGSLFPRSPSLEPEHSSVSREQRVRFASKILDSPHAPFSPRKSRPRSSVSSSPPSTPRHRKQFDPTVQAAIGRFQDDADPSILLPKMQTSPHAVHHYSGVERDKGTATEAIPIEDCEASGILRVRGKEKELESVLEDLDRNERRLESSIEAETSFLEKIEQDKQRDKEKIRMLEGEIERLKNELMRRTTFHPPPPPPPPNMIALPNDASNPSLFASARASLRHAPRPIENPINPLPATRRAAGMPTVGIPPDKMAAFLNEMKTVKLRKVSASERRSTSLGTDTSFASAPNMSIGGGAGSSSSLLRKSFSSVNQLPDGRRGSRSVDSTGNHTMSEIGTRRGEKRKRSFTGSQEELRAPPHPLRYRLAASSTESSFAMASNASFNHTNDSLAGPSQPYPPLRLANSANSTGGSWPSSSVTDAPTPSLCSDNDLERDEVSLDDQLPSTPPVVTGPSRAFFRFKGNGIPVNPERLRRRNSDVIMTDALQPEQESSYPGPNPKPPNIKPTIFDKRPPTSPFPEKSPRRPRPPVRKTQTNQHTLPSHSTPCGALSDDDEDPLSLTFSSPERVLQASELRRIQAQQNDAAFSRASPPPTTPASSSRTTLKAPAFSHAQAQALPRPRRSPRHRSTSVSSRSSRRLTLDEELRNAFAAAAASSSHPDPDETHIYDNVEDSWNEECVLVGVGTRSKGRGFLPGGGAAGVPVFRGVGYVEGATEDEEPLDDEPRHRRRSPPSTRGVYR